MDGEPDYKHTIDVNKDGKIDVIKYGLDDPQGSGEIYWHTVIQDFESKEITVDRKLEEEQRTEWFDIDDQIFAHYDFNVMKLLAIVLTLPLISFHIAKMMLPDVDYWAQKSTQRLVQKQEYVKSSFYSVTIDNDRDGYADSQINYEKTDINVYYEVSEYKETILAAKHQDVFTYLGEYIAKSMISLFTGSRDDFIFNDQLTEAHLDSSDFSSCNSYTQKNADVLRATYRKFSENTFLSYIDTLERSTLTIIDWNGGEIEEQRVYTDDFENGEIENADDFFSSLSAEHSITDIDTGQEVTVDFDSEFPYTHPANITWDCETWGPDNVPIKYDSLQVIKENYYYYTTNVFEKEIIIRIPNRYSLYNDYGKGDRFSVEDGGWAEFKVKGMLITPPDGLVYYTSDVDSFISDSAKVSGHYFYVDSDLNGFYETVYILKLNDYFSTDISGTPIYTVMSIGLNYDGIHDFVPYERLYDRKLVVSNFETLAQESVMFESDWIYNFRHLKDEELLKETESKLEEYNLKPKDQIFEIYKLVQTSEQNSEFSELFYEIRHKTYSTAWEQYKEQLIGDIAEQVFMSVTASLLSAAVEAIITAVTAGTGWGGAKAVGALTYLSVYTLMTKFYIDIDLAKAEAEKRSQAFYSVSSDNREPTSLNEKNLLDRVLGDSMAAALIGHPGGYYTEVSGGESGNMYTGQLLVSPPNLLRMFYSFEGFLDLLWENIWSMGESDPDAYAALDFDDVNLDYFLLTSELPSYNQNPYYTYENADGIFDLYNMYALNTLGYLETQVKDASSGQYDAIRATCIDGRPQYEFINSTLYQSVRPQSVLYRPIVLSEERYNQLQPAPGRLVVNTRCKDYSNTYGIDPYAMSDVEREVYEAKVPLNDNGFEYPIRYISIDVVKYNIYTGFSYFVKGLIVNKSDYSIDLGNLYFAKSIEAIVSEKDSGFEDFLSDALAHELIESKIYYNIHIVFDVFIPDTTDESSRLALAQATSHTIMDYFNQYVFAETTANSISEITYTETMTFWSTLISAPLVYFGSWAVSAGVGKMFSEAGANAVKASIHRSIVQGLVGMVVSPIQEIFQEIIEDGFIEALSENLIDMAGGTDDLGFWVSSFATSVRETTGALGKLALGDASVAFGDANLKTKLSLISARVSRDANAIAKITASVQQNVEQKQADADLKRQQMNSWQKILSSGFFKGLLMVLPAVLYGSFSFVALKGLNNMIESTQSAVPKAYARYKSEVQAYRRGKLIKWVGTQDALVNNLQEYMKKPAELEAAKPEINEKYKASQNTEKENPPLAAFLSSLNPNPKSESKKSLANKFSTLAFEGIFKDWSASVYEDIRFKSIQELILKTESNYRIIGHVQAESQILDAMKAAIKNYEGELTPADQRFFDMWGTSYLDPHVILCGVPKTSVIRDLEIKDYVIEGTKASKDAIITDLQEIYGIGVSLDMFAIQGNLLLKIPDGASNVDSWIVDNGLNPRTAKIIIVPSILANPEAELLSGKGVFNEHNYQEGTPSPYWPLFSKFRDSLINLFKSNPDLNVAGNNLAVSRFISALGNQKLLSNKLSAMKNGLKAHFDVVEDTLLNWHVEITFKLDEKLREGRITQELRDNVKRDVDSLFSEQYSLYGYSRRNPVYFSARFALYMATRVLYETPYVTSLSFKNLCTDLEFRSGFESYLDPQFTPEKAVWESLSGRISNLLDERGATAYEIEVIEAKLKPYLDKAIEKISLSNLVGDIFEGKVQTPRILLLNDIMNCPETDALKQVVNTPAPMRTLSRLLVKHPTDYPGGKKFENGGNWLSGTFLSNADLKDIGSLIPFITRAATWTIADFQAEGIQITQSELLALQKHVKDTIYRHLYDRNTINHQNLMFDDLTEAIYNAIQAVHIAIAIHEGDPFISINDASTKVGKRQYTNYLTQGTLLGPKTIIEFSNEVYSYILENLYSDGDIMTQYQEENFFYIEALNALDKLSEVQNLIRPIRIMMRQTVGLDTRGYALLWSNDNYKWWNVLMQMGDLFATEALSFESLKDTLFDGDPNTGLFQPNHMDNTVIGKTSLALYDQVLSNDDYHNTLHTMSRQDQEALKHGIRRLISIGINGRGSGPNQEITEVDIRRVFRGKTFSVKSRLTHNQEFNIPILRTNGIKGLWDDHFAKVPLHTKLNSFNKKVTDFRNELTATNSLKQAYITLYDKYPKAKSNYYNAKNFNNQLGGAALLGRNIRNIWSVDKFMHLYEALLSSIIFAP